MTRNAGSLPLIILTALFAALCGCSDRGSVPDDAPAKAAVENVAQTFQNEVASNASDKPPAAHSDEIDTGTGRWTSSFEEKTPVSKEGVTRRAFRLVIRNRSNSPQKFESKIDYLDREGLVLRTKALPDVVIPPYADKIFEDELAVPDKVAVTILTARPEIAKLSWDETR